MGPIEIILIVVCALVVGGVIINRILMRKQGKCADDCGCDCSHCARCKYADLEKKYDKHTKQ